MKKVMILFLGMFLLMNLAMAQNTWRSVNYDVSNHEIINTGNQLLNTEFWLTAGYCNPTDGSNYVYVGNLDADGSNREMLLHCNDALMMYNMTLYELNHVSPTSLDEGSVQLYDYDGDGIDEIIGFHLTTLYIYKYNTISELWAVDKTFVYGTNIALLSCYQGYCYFVDSLGNLNKYNPITNSVVDQISDGQGNACGRITIGECNSEIAGEEIVWMLNEDGSGGCNDLGMVSISFTGEQYYENVRSPIIDEIECATDNSTNLTYVGYKLSSSTYVGSPCGFESDLFLEQPSVVYTINSSNEAEELLYFVDSYLSTTGGSFAGSFYSVGDVEFVDYGDDGDLDFCYAQATAGRTGCNGVPTYGYISGRCRDLDGTLERGGHGVPVNPNDADYDHPTEQYVMDIDNDGTDELMFGGYYLNLDTGTAVNMGSVKVSSGYTYSHFGGFCLNQYWSIDNTLYSDLSGSTCIFDGDSFNVTATTIDYIFRERFRPDPLAPYQIDEQNCSDTGHPYFSWDDKAFGEILSLENDWYCYTYNKSVDTVVYTDSNSTYYNTIYGLKKINIGVPDTYDVLTSFANTGEWSSLPAIENADVFEFTCAQDPVYTGNDTYNYIMFSQGSNYELNDSLAYPLAISLNNGGCNQTNYSLNHGVNLSYAECCELYAIEGNDCKVTTKTTYNFTRQELQSACPSVTDAPFTSGINRVDLFRERQSGSSDYSYIDDLSIYTVTVAGNILPTFGTLSCVPDPQNVSEIVSCGYTMFDSDDPENESYTAFDCEDDGTLDYGWALRGWTGAFNCTYSTEGLKTARLWISDVFHYPAYNTSGTDIVTISLEEGEGAPVQGGNCIGFTAPACAGECYYYDDFSYSNPIECNDWEGTANDVNPTAGQFSVFNLPVTKQNIYLDGENYDGGIIYESMYTNFWIDFDLTLSDNSPITFYVLDETLSEYSVFLVFNNYDMRVYDPTLTTLGTLTPDQQYNIKMLVNLVNDTVIYLVDDSPIYQGDFYDGGSSSQRFFHISWSSIDADFDIDNFRIRYGVASPNATLPEVEVEYTYNPDLFCAINWSSNITGDRFSEQNCIDRGYNIEGNLVSLCLPRACISDVGSAFFSWATSNIFFTIIIAIAFILVAPILFRRK